MIVSEISLELDRTVTACLSLAHGQRDGCLFVIESQKTREKYYKDFNADIFKKNGRRFSVFDKVDRQLIYRLAGVDGAIIINCKGEMMHYGATLLHSERMIGHGKRHAFALGTSRVVKGAVCVLASEEDKHIRVFDNGAMVTDVNKDTQIAFSTRHKVAEVLNSPITKTLAASGIAASILTLNPIPAIVTITGSFAVVSEGFNRLKALLFD